MTSAILNSIQPSIIVKLTKRIQRNKVHVLYWLRNSIIANYLVIIVMRRTKIIKSVRNLHG